jgi:hypothetical protein
LLRGKQEQQLRQLPPLEKIDAILLPPEEQEVAAARKPNQAQWQLARDHKSLPLLQKPQNTPL